MAEQMPTDSNVERVTQRLKEDLVDDSGRPAEASDVADVVEAKAASFADAPVQEFVPLLIEHQARDELRLQGLHRDLADEEGEAGGQDRDAP